MSEPPNVYEGPGPNSDAFDPKRHFWDGLEWWTMDRLFWWDGMRWQPQGAPHVSGLAPSLGAPVAQRKPRPPGYWRDFWLGFVGVVAGNVVLLIVVGSITSSSSSFGTVASLLPWILNIGVLILFAVIRPRVALGMLLAYGIAFALVLCAGIVLYVICFSASSGVP